MTKAIIQNLIQHVNVLYVAMSIILGSAYFSYPVLRS